MNELPYTLVEETSTGMWWIEADSEVIGPYLSALEARMEAEWMYDEGGHPW